MDYELRISGLSQERALTLYAALTGYAREDLHLSGDCFTGLMAGSIDEHISIRPKED